MAARTAFFFLFGRYLLFLYCCHLSERVCFVLVFFSDIAAYRTSYVFTAKTGIWIENFEPRGNSWILITMEHPLKPYDPYGKYDGRTPTASRSEHRLTPNPRQKFPDATSVARGGVGAVTAIRASTALAFNRRLPRYANNRTRSLPLYAIVTGPRKRRNVYPEVIITYPSRIYARCQSIHHRPL